MTVRIGPDSLVRNSTNVVELQGLRDRLTGLYAVDAAVTFTLKDVAGTAIITAAAMPIVDATAARPIYRGAIPDTADLSAASHVITITATRAGSKGVWKTDSSMQTVDSI